MPDTQVVELSTLDLVGAASLVLVAGVTSLLLRLSLERQLLIGMVRATVQLLLVGFALRWIFGHVHWALTFGAASVMIVLATRAALQRASHTLAGAFLGSFVTLVLSAGVFAVLGSALFVGAEPWYHPRYLLPLLGMLLGNGLTGISLCLDSLLSTFAEDRERVELELALGATRWEAARDPVRRSVRRGIVPIVNAMMVAGVVSLPGMMTGQILSGTEPVEAVKYQLLILFLIAGATSLGCLGVAAYAAHRAIDEDHRLRGDRLTSR
ncbi:MAG: iron export ABC transporter permease subunit FetB [Sandaracinus sp.]|nr:iron export ABC transporter permease subunit FetB [Sandaracinus sp.]MCB9620948.1 iron export ABC transporter permease subunit FetB [Sandaracinus sp.]